ncbi:hypothetical protein HRR79_001702 [Exophiala dermatitidis]|nr:hypothetical protein HRR79_001702 [Exophiala dermatitidis]
MGCVGGQRRRSAQAKQGIQGKFDLWVFIFLISLGILGFGSQSLSGLTLSRLSAFALDRRTNTASDMIGLDQMDFLFHCFPSNRGRFKPESQRHLELSLRRGCT